MEPYTNPTQEAGAPQAQAPSTSPPHAEALHRDAQRALARRLPKVLLHEHLDGNLRIPTLFDLLKARGLTPPAPDVPALMRWFHTRAHAGSLPAYLEGFGLTVAAMADLGALRRVAFEAAEDARAQGCVLAEFRMAPLLFEEHGLKGEAVVEALLEGLAMSPLPSGLIVCAMRQLPPWETLRAAKLALAYQGRGVVGFDLAGPELGFPATAHHEALALVHNAGLALTLHAGEADGGLRVVEAARLGARRVGHGVRLAESLAPGGPRAWLDEVVERGVHLEVCPTSNLHTGAATSLATHPITALLQAGVSLSYHTDNTLMSCLTHGDEAENLLVHTPLQVQDLLAMARQAARASFLDEAARSQALESIDRFEP